jgi:RHH-type proline utilization regulon transcriptional repressor/proline dehydrogenase/delta 1-pyrroline-5-carboxylate dehydrogenase
MTDRCFEEMTDSFLAACPTAEPGRGKGDIASGSPRPFGVKLALGSHNVRSIAAALATLEARSLPRNAIELQMLHGMADQLKYAAADMGLRIREYVPVGEMIPGMAYLVRRLLENTSNESWLKAGFLDQADAGALLRKPMPKDGHTTPPGAGVMTVDLTAAAARHKLSPSSPLLSDASPFFTEPVRDFSDSRQWAAFAASITRATVPRIPNDRTPAQAAAMVDRAHAAFDAWRGTDPVKRCEAMIRAAKLMRQQRDALSFL